MHAARRWEGEGRGALYTPLGGWGRGALYTLLRWSDTCTPLTGSGCSYHRSHSPDRRFIDLNILPGSAKARSVVLYITGGPAAELVCR